MDNILFKNLMFRGLTRRILLGESHKMKIVVTVNAEFIVLANEDENFKQIINDNYATFDGQIPFLLAKCKFPQVEIEKISGSDFIFDICQNAKERSWRVFLLGGYDASNRGAVRVLREKYGIDIEGFSPEYQPYPFTDSHNRQILERLKQFRPHYLLVGFGAKKQECWIVEHRELLNACGVRLAIGVGGTFEFVSGVISRAPRWIQKVGLEGCYRFVNEPNLLRFKRLVVSLKVFKY